MFKSLEEIDTVCVINGLPIDQIEKRSMPLQDKTRDPEEWRFRSFDGFLAENEKFKDVVKADWKTVQLLGTSHHELASNIRDLLALVESKRTTENLGVMTSITVDFTAHISSQTCKSQRLHVSHQLYNGYQYSLFYNSNNETSLSNTKWYEEYLIQNMESKLSVKIAGNGTVGIVECIQCNSKSCVTLVYIDYMGFYEGGGVKNNYRVDPLILFAVLTGKCTQSTINVAKEREAWQLQEPASELR